MSKRLSLAEYKKIKVLKQKIKSVPEKETDKPLIHSTVKMRPAYAGMSDFLFPYLSLMFRIRNRRYF